jgi:hypothetical protein
MSVKYRLVRPDDEDELDYLCALEWRRFVQFHVKMISQYLKTLLRSPCFLANSFPLGEATPGATLKENAKQAPEYFLVGELDGKIFGFVRFGLFLHKNVYPSKGCSLIVITVVSATRVPSYKVTRASVHTHVATAPYLCINSVVVDERMRGKGSSPS